MELSGIDAGRYSEPGLDPEEMEAFLMGFYNKEIQGEPKPNDCSERMLVNFHVQPLAFISHLVFITLDADEIRGEV